MGAHKTTQPVDEHRIMTADLYALKGWFPGGECVDHIVRGERIRLAKGPDGRTWLYARDRRYALSPNQRYDARARSRPLRAGE